MKTPVRRENTGEDWAEKIAAEIARRMGLDAARVELATYRGHRGSVSENFTVFRGESLVHGNEILAGQILGYDPQKRLKQSDHTFDNIVAAIRKMMPDHFKAVLQHLAWYPVLDALIGNTDRHHENWGFLIHVMEPHQSPQQVLRLAPSFDHASSLGRELLDAGAAKYLAVADGVERYVRGGHGGVYWDSTTRKSPCPLALVELGTAKYPDHFRQALQAVAAIPVTDLDAIVDQVPAAIMSDASRRFAKALLAFNHRVLSGLAS